MTNKEKLKDFINKLEKLCEAYGAEFDSNEKGIMVVIDDVCDYLPVTIGPIHNGLDIVDIIEQD